MIVHLTIIYMIIHLTIIWATGFDAVQSTERFVIL